MAKTILAAGSRETGFPVGGFYATHPETGETLRAANAKYGDLPPRFATSEKAEAWGTKRLSADRRLAYIKASKSREACRIAFDIARRAKRP